MDTIRRFFLIIAGLVIANLAFAQQVRFDAEASGTEVGVGVPFDVTFTLHNAKGSSFSPPSFGVLQVLSGPNMMTTSTFVNGAQSSSVGYSFTLVASKKGAVTIGPAKIIVKGQTLTTSPVKVNVSKSSASRQAPASPFPPGHGFPGFPGYSGGSPRSSTDVDKKVRQNCILQLVPEKQSLIQGEPILLTLRVLTRLTLEDIRITALPESGSFSLREMEGEAEGRSKVVQNGMEFLAIPIKQFILTAKESGALKIPPLHALLSVPDPEGFGFFKEIMHLEMQTPPFSLTVKALPKTNLAFSGAVGKFKVSHSIDKLHLGTDESITYVLEVTGFGDVSLIEPPKLKLGTDSFEVFDPKSEERNTTEGQRLAGLRKFEYIIQPKKEGKFDFKPEFVYFDSEIQKYVSSSDSFEIEVAKGSGMSKSRKAATLSAIITSGPTFVNGSFADGIWVWLIALAPIFPFVWWFWRYKRKKEPIEEISFGKFTQEDGAIIKQVASHPASSGYDVDFHSNLAKKLTAGLSNKLGENSVLLTRETIRTLLNNQGKGAEYIQRVMKVFEVCDQVAFMGVAPDMEEEALVKEVEDLLTNY